ncbi:MAG: ABC transporter permease [Bacteroidales bacterium]|nr:ABC transporter permease [Bacteroidales bacterium]
MRTILAIVRKEFLQVFRNRVMLPILFVVPFVQLIILVNAATLEIKNIRISFVDNDFSSTTRSIFNKFAYSPFFKIQPSFGSFKDAEIEMKKGKTDVIITFPSNFEKKLKQEGKAELQVNINAINGVVAGISAAYVQSIIASFLKEEMGKSYTTILPVQIKVITHHWFNPQLNYKNFMLPAILALLVTMIGMLLSTLNFVREKEIGTIEQINVTPIRKYQFIIGKFLPFLLLALVELSMGLIIGKLLYDIPMLGNLGNLFIFTILYLIVVMSVGLLVAVSSRTQQQALFVLFFLLLVSIMLSGIFTSVETMPYWAQKLNLINPIYYFMRVIRMILLKGSSFLDLLPEFISLCIFAVILWQILLVKYRKSTI